MADKKKEESKPEPTPVVEPTQAEIDEANFQRIQREARERRTGIQELR